LTGRAAPQLSASYISRMEIREERSSSMFMRVRGIEFRAKRSSCRTRPKSAGNTSFKTWSILWIPLEDTFARVHRVTQKGIAY